MAVMEPEADMLCLLHFSCRTSLGRDFQLHRGRSSSGVSSRGLFLFVLEDDMLKTLARNLVLVSCEIWYNMQQRKTVNSKLGNSWATLVRKFGHMTIAGADWIAGYTC